MPTLGQSNTSIYGDIQLPKPLSITGQTQGRALAGPTKGQLDFVAEQQKQAQIQALAQQYGDDYDGFVKALANVDQPLAYEAGTKLSAWRKGQAESDIAQTQKARAFTKFGAQNLQYAVDHPELLPIVKQMVGAVDPNLMQMVPDPSDPQYNEKMTDLITRAQDTEKFLDSREKAGQLYVDGKHDLAAATMLAGSLTPEQRQVTEGLLKKGGIAEFAQMFPDAASAQAYLQKQQEMNPQKGETGWKLEDRMIGGKPTAVWVNPNQQSVKPAPEAGKPLPTKGAAGGAGGSAAAGTALSPEGVDYAATIYRLTNKMPPLGMGKTPARYQIINKAAEQTHLLGQTPVVAVQRQAAMAADTKALAQMQKMSSAAEAYENKALAQMDLVDGLSDKVSRTSIPLLNRAIIAGQTEIAGDQNATLLLNAIQTASNEYAKIMMGGTGSAQAVTDSASKEAQKLLNAAMNPKTLRAATQLMRREMGLTMDGYSYTIQHINDRLGGAPQTPQTGAPEQKPIPGIPGGVAELRNGRWIRVK